MISATLQKTLSPVDLSALILQSVMKAAVDKLGAGRAAALSTLQPEIRKVSASLARIEQTLEENRVTPLRAAVTCLQIGDEAGALQRLIDAEASDPYAAVPKFWLGVLLAARGQHDLAQAKLTDALRLSHAVVPEVWLPPDVTRADYAMPRRAGLRWVWNSVDLIKPLVPEPARRFWDVSLKEERLAGAGLSGDSIIILVETPSPRDACLARLDAETSEVRWVQRLPRVPKGLPPRRLLATSSALVAVSEPESMGVSLFAAEGAGRLLRTVSQHYLEAMTFPGLTSHGSTPSAGNPSFNFEIVDREEELHREPAPVTQTAYLHGASCSYVLENRYGHKWWEKRSDTYFTRAFKQDSIQCFE